MADEEKKKSFWETLPGIITALAAFLGGVAAVITALNGGNREGAAKTEAAPPSAAPAVNDEAVRRAAAEAKAKAEAQAAEPKITIDDFTGMKLVYVPGGCFNMGSPPDEEGRDENEGPAHKVCVDSFWMGQYEVTQGQWEKVMGVDANCSFFKKGGNYPVENVSWDDAQKFIKKLNSRSGKNYRLPTEAEWEHACRANSSGKYCGGDDADAVAWREKNSGETTHAVGGKKANAFSLYDMSGNVWEWCADWHDSGYYASSPKDNPQGPDKESLHGVYRVIRGGGWFSSPMFVRAAVRSWGSPAFHSEILGLRLALSVR